MKLTVLLSCVLSASWVAAAVNVPLEVSNWTDVSRTDEHVTAGVPLPQGAVTDLTKLRILDGSGNALPAQFKALSRWWDEKASGITNPSVKWVLCDFQAPSVAASGKASFTLKDDNSASTPVTSLNVNDEADKITVNTGPLKFTVSKTHFNLFDELWLGSAQVIASNGQNGGFVTAGDWAAGECIAGTVHSTTQAPPDSVVIEENGPMKVVLRVEGRHFAASNSVSKGLYGYQVYLTAYAGRPYVDVQFALTNTLLEGQAPSEVKAYVWPIKGWMLDLRLASAAGTWNWALPEGAGSTGTLDANGLRVLQTKTGTVFNGAAALFDGTLGVRFAVRDFAVRSPKAFQLRPGRLTLEFLPDTGGQYSLDPHSRYNQRFRMEFFNGAVSVDSLKAMMKKTDAPLRMLAPQAWYRNTKAWYRGFGVSPHASCTRAASTSWTRMDKSAAAEWEKYGDFGGFNGVGDHVNLTSCFWAYLQTGQPKDFETPESWTFHFNDIVPIQTASTRWTDLNYMMSAEEHLPGYSCPDPEFGYTNAILAFPGWQRHRGDTPDAGHMPNLQVLEYYLLTGDPATREAIESQAMRAAGNIYSRTYANPYTRWVQTGPIRAAVLDSVYMMTYGPRYIGRPVIVTGQGYEVTGNSRYLRPMQIYAYSIRNWIRRSPIGYFGMSSDGGVANVWALNHPDIPTPASMWMTDFQIGIATEAIYYYWKLTGDAEIHDAVIYSGKSFEWRAAKDSTGYKGFIYGGWADYLCEGERYSSGSFESSANEGFGGLIFGYLASGRQELYNVINTARAWYEGIDFRSLDLKSADFWEATYKHDSLDIIPPAAVQDLTAQAGGPGTVQLGWTSPGNDSLQGRAAYYRIKYATAPIVDMAQRWDKTTGRGWPDLRDPLPYGDTAWVNRTDAFRNREEISFWAAHAVSNPPLPLAGMTSQLFTVSGLPEGVTLYFALVAFDSAGNASGVSNVAFTVPAEATHTYRFMDTLPQQLVTRIRPLVTLADGHTDSTGQGLYFRAIDTALIQVDWDGKVTARYGAAGKARVEVQRGLAVFDTLSIMVTPGAARCDSIILSRENAKMCVSDTFQLYPMRTYFSEKGQQYMRRNLWNGLFTWTSASPAVASVAFGKVVGLSAGVTAVIAEYLGTRDTVWVKVRPRPQFLKRLDFRCDTLPPSFGWLGVSGQAFDIARGYGFVYGSPDCRTDRGGGYLLGTFVAGANMGFRIAAPAGEYIVRFALGDNGYPPAGIVNWVNIGNDTIAAHARIPNAGNTICDDTIAVSGDSGVTFNVNGTLCYMVMISKEGIAIDSVADDSGVAVPIPQGVAIAVENRGIPTVKRMALSAFPMPFNPSVNIAFALLPQTQAVYTIFNPRGQLMFRKVLSAGESGAQGAFIWNGRDLNGRSAPTGFYFGELTATDGKRLTHRLVLLK